MNKSDIVSRVADRMGLSKSTAEGAVDTVLGAISEALAREETVRIAVCGTFATRRRSVRTGRNPRPGESVSITASKAPSFKAAKALRQAVNTGRKPEATDRAENREMRQRAHGEAGAAFDVSDWPGGVEPARTGECPGAEGRAAGGKWRRASRRGPVDAHLANDPLTSTANRIAARITEVTG